MSETKLNKSIRNILDSFQNFVSRIGNRTDNITRYNSYQWDPLVNERLKLEYMYSGSWIAKKAIETPVHDMMKSGITLHGLEREQTKAIQKTITELDIRNKFSECMKWARLYGGSVGYIRIDGQDPSTPLDISTIGPKQFLGISPLSRWQITPSIGHMIEGGVDDGLPEYYNSVFDNNLYSKPFTIHHSRVIRFIGIEVPWYQKIALLFWGQSVLVNIHPQIEAYDSIKGMIDQLANKAHLRTLSIKGMRDLLSMGGINAEEELLKYVAAIRLTQSTEDITLIDADDTFEASSYTFTGLKDLMDICGEQIAAATGIPQSKLFGREADGLNASHSGDNKNYLSNLEAERENILRAPFTKILQIIAKSESINLPEDFSFTFDSLDLMSDDDIAELGAKLINTISETYKSGLISTLEARNELSKISLMTKLFDDIEGDVKVNELIEENDNAG